MASSSTREPGFAGLASSDDHGTEATALSLAGAPIVTGDLVDGSLIVLGAVIVAPRLLSRAIPGRLVISLRVGRTGREQRRDRHRGHDHHPRDEHLHLVSPYRERRRRREMGAAWAIHNRSKIEEIIAGYQIIAGPINYS